MNLPISSILDPDVWYSIGTNHSTRHILLDLPEDRTENPRRSLCDSGQSGHSKGSDQTKILQLSPRHLGPYQ